MHEYMKKALLAALLIASAAFAHYLPNVAEFPDRATELARATPSPLFWQFLDKLLSRELAKWIQTVSYDSQESEWPAEFRNALACLVIQASLKHALEESRPAAGEQDRTALPHEEFCPTPKANELQDPDQREYSMRMESESSTILKSAGDWNRAGSGSEKLMSVSRQVESL
jgi:hypothetical protein